MKSLKDMFKATAVGNGKNEEMLPLLTMYDEKYRKLVLIPLDYDASKGHYGQGRVEQRGKAACAVLSQPGKRALLVPIKQGYSCYGDTGIFLSCLHLCEGELVTMTSLKFKDEDESENKY